MKLLITIGILALVSLAAPPTPPPLKTALQVHRLSTAEAQRASPVLLRGIVTEVMPEWHGFAFQDATDALYVTAGFINAPVLEIGQSVEIAGRTAPGNFAPIVSATKVRVLGTGHLPAPRPADWKFISSGSCDNDYVEIEGVVRSVSLVGPPAWRWHATALHVDIGGNLIWAYLRNTNGLAPEKLPDSSVRIDGVCVVLANSRRQFEQNILLIPAASGVHVVEAAREDPFAVPLTPIDRLFQYKPTSNIPHRVRVRGVVTSSGASRVFLQDENSGLMVRAAAASVRVGDLAEAVGFPSAGTYSTVLEDALLRDAGPSHTPAPLDIAAGEVMSRSRDDRPALPDAMLVRVQGTLLDTSRAARDEVLVLQDGDTVFTARYLRPPRSQSLPPLTQGDRVVVTGVCVIEVSDLGAARSFELLMRSPADVRIRRPAPWFTRSVALRLSAALLAIAAGTAIWVALLRRRVRAQTEIIRHQIERESALGKRFRDLVENASDMVYTRDLEGCLIHVNQGTERLTGYTRAELLRMNFLDLLAPEERERARQQLASRTPEQHSDFDLAEWRFLRKDGRELTLEVSKRFIYLGDGQIRVESIGRDVTARKQALFENQERFRTLADNIAQLAWMADERGFIFWYNQRWFDYTGATLDATRGWGWQDWHHPDHVARVLARIQHSFETGETWEDTFPLRGRDAQYRWFLGAAMPIRNPSGRVVRWFGTYTDITEHKQVEAALEKSNQDLRQFAYVASHDLQEPLRNVCIFAEMLKRTYQPNEITPERSHFIDIVTAGAHRMEWLIRDLLAYSSLTISDEPDRQRIDCQPLLEQTLLNLSATIGESGATITHDPDPLPAIDASESQLSQVLENLIGNAIKYRRPDVPLHIHLNAERRFDSWLFCVRDNGMGFDPKYAESVFRIFKRLHGSEIPGTGIGLAICKTIIERHGGSIWAEAQPGEGATFYFSIPDLKLDRLPPYS